MIADSNLTETPARSELPRAYDPSVASRLSLPQTRPGWDPGPERRIDDGRSIGRMLAFAGIGLAMLLTGAALLRARNNVS